MSWANDQSLQWVNRAYPGLGIPGSALPATGTSGAAPMWYCKDSGDDTKEWRWTVLTTPSAGTFQAYEDGSFSLSGAPDGSYSFTARVYVDGVSLGVMTVSMTIANALMVTMVFTDGESNVMSANASVAAAQLNVSAIFSDTETSIMSAAATVSSPPAQINVSAIFTDNESNTVAAAVTLVAPAGPIAASAAFTDNETSVLAAVAFSVAPPPPAITGAGGPGLTKAGKPVWMLTTTLGILADGTVVWRVLGTAASDAILTDKAGSSGIVL